MARKAKVDRDTVLQLLKEGNTSQSIADRFGVSRQAIDLYRKQFTSAGLLPETRHARASIIREPLPGGEASHRPPDSPAPRPQRVSSAPKPPLLDMDQVLELLIRAFNALKRVPELEAEIAGLKKNNEELAQQITRLTERDIKRREQEQRWLEAQQPGVLTYRPPSPSPP